MATGGDRFRMCVVASRVVGLVARLGGCVAGRVVDGTRYVAGFVVVGTGFVVVGTQYCPPSSAVANDTATRTAMAPIVAALAIC